MSTSAAKRRRIDAASTTLSKPFRSPFKTPFKSPLKSTPISKNSPATPQPNTPSLDATKTSHNPSTESANATAGTETPCATASTVTPIRARPPKKKYLSPTSAAALNNDPDIAPLLRKQRELEKQLREIKEELETAEQARKIEVDSMKRQTGEDGDVVVDGELIDLIGKWTAASRQAAEEMFGTVRDRVNRMGGPRAWKEMQKRQQEFQNSWDQPEESNNNDDDEDSDDGEGEKRDIEKRDLYAEYDVDPETENEKAQRTDTGEDPGQEDEFTMAMMLRTLNVDLKVIGYDREAQRWAD